jgi:hypothetical protein
VGKDKARADKMNFFKRKKRKRKVPQEVELILYKIIGCFQPAMCGL